MIQSITIFNAQTVSLLYNKSYQHTSDKQTQYTHTLVQCNILSALYQQPYTAPRKQSVSSQKHNKHAVSKRKNSVKQTTDTTEPLAHIRIDDKHIIECTADTVSISYIHTNTHIVTNIVFEQPLYNNTDSSKHTHTDVQHLNIYQNIVQYISNKFHSIYDPNIKAKQLKSTFNVLLQHTIYTHIQHILLSLVLNAYNTQCTESQQHISWLYVVYNDTMCDSTMQQLQTINLLPVTTTQSKHVNNNDDLNTSAIIPDVDLSTPDGLLQFTQQSDNKQYIWHNDTTHTKPPWWCCITAHERIVPVELTPRNSIHAVAYNNITNNKLTNNTIQHITAMIEHSINLCMVQCNTLQYICIHINQYMVHMERYNNIIVVYQCIQQCAFDIAGLHMMEQLYTFLHPRNR